ncbi:MAG: hypothetical protein B7Y40_03650 [Gammaproteobacteria bacterium 28-57-27]|nr:MAG: hypothetical protein B7Y40_03650 [Gammaproteobacteria bacterium 28-57-27]
MKYPYALLTLFIAIATGSTLYLQGCGGSSSSDSASSSPTPTPPPANPTPEPPINPSGSLRGEKMSTLLFSNPYPHIPAQCYIETSNGTQNACQFCHTNGVYGIQLGNNLPQAGAVARLGNLQLDYSFAPFDQLAPLATVNRWENTLTPEKLLEAVKTLGMTPASWDMRSYIREDNWSAAFAQRPGNPKNWDGQVDTPFRLFPALAPADLPAQSDGFVRSLVEARGFFNDGQGWNTGWRAVNFMPYGIFSPMTGSVSGIYIRLPVAFMLTEGGTFSLDIYKRNLDLVERAIQDRLTPADGANYLGFAKTAALLRGEYPVGTEFAHPLHYVDVAADGSNPGISRFPGARAQRVKEIRYMYKWKEFHHQDFRPGDKEEGLPVFGNNSQGWVDNGTGWFLAGFIEDKDGALRPQNMEEMTQCIGCHSGVYRTEIRASFTSGTGNTIDSTWALPRKWAGDSGWGEMNYLGYQAKTGLTPGETPGSAHMGDPINRYANKGELRYFLDNVVGASLYGDMPASIENALASSIQKARGYASDWPRIDTSSPEAFKQSQQARQALMRTMTARGDYLTAEGHVQGALLYPPEQDALAAAARYRQVVVTQRYAKGKDVFPQTPVNYHYLRTENEAFTHADDTPYAQGQVITDRAVDRESPVKDSYLVGNVPTLIDENKSFAEGGTYNADYIPLMKPGAFEVKP